MNVVNFIPMHVVLTLLMYVKDLNQMHVVDFDPLQVA